MPPRHYGSTPPMCADMMTAGEKILMKFIRTSAVVRKLMWRLVRKIYTYARGDGQNDPRTNGEYWLLEHVVFPKSGCPASVEI